MIVRRPYTHVMPGAERVGIMGGTFDPVHVGHIVAAVDVRYALRLDRLLMPVAPRPWQKEGEVIAPASARFAMLEAAVASLDGVEASSVEIRRAGQTYTADTVAELRAPGRELFLAVGSDVAVELDSWHHVEQVRPHVTLVIVSRAGERATVPSPAWKVEHVEIPRLDVSSTAVRARLESGHPVDGLVPAAAIRVIRELDLYTSS